jgi:hypothetical protein
MCKGTGGHENRRNAVFALGTCAQPTNRNWQMWLPSSAAPLKSGQSQLLALLVDAKRGEMVVDFARGRVADMALGASMPHHRRAVC